MCNFKVLRYKGNEYQIAPGSCQITVNQNVEIILYKCKLPLVPAGLFQGLVACHKIQPREEAAETSVALNSVVVELLYVNFKY